MKNVVFVLFIVLFFAFIFWDDIFFSPDNWEQQIESIGSSSSPRAVDLTGDGILDIVMGGAAREFTATKHGIIALDGASGELLWSVPAVNQVFGSPVFQDLNQDGTPDVLIGGRTAIFNAIDGKTGKKMWQYMKSYEGLDLVNDRSILNFYNPQLIPDQDGDGLLDILTAYGGFIKAQPQDSNRPTGSLKVLSSKDGSELASVLMPDGRETYMSPLVHDFNNDGNLTVLFGSGGETMDGHFYVTSLESVMNGDISGATVIADGLGKGFIAPAVLADVNEDDVKDIVINSVRGSVYCVDGSTMETLWEAKLGTEFEGYTSPSPGDFNDDDITDFFVSYGHGIWPGIDFAYQVMVDGKDGSIISADTAGTFQYASPVTFDLSRDGNDDAIVVLNTKENQKTGLTFLEIFVNELLVYDPHNEEQFRFHQKKAGSNLGSTPLLTDLDGDNYLDIIYTYMNDPINYYSFKSIMIERIETNIKLRHPVRWGEYMGPNYDGTYDN